MKINFYEFFKTRELLLFIKMEKKSLSGKKFLYGYIKYTPDRTLKIFKVILILIYIQIKLQINKPLGCSGSWGCSFRRGRTRAGPVTRTGP